MIRPKDNGRAEREPLLDDMVVTLLCSPPGRGEDAGEDDRVKRDRINIEVELEHKRLLTYDSATTPYANHTR